MNEANKNEGVYCLDGLQQNDIEQSFYVTSDQSESTSILDASKFPNSVGECKFSGNLNDGFELNFTASEWLVFKNDNKVLTIIFSIQNGVNPMINLDDSISFNYYIKHETILSSGVSISTFRICSKSYELYSLAYTNRNLYYDKHNKFIYI